VYLIFIVSSFVLRDLISNEYGRLFSRQVFWKFPKDLNVMSFYL